MNGGKWSVSESMYIHDFRLCKSPMAPVPMYIGTSVYSKTPLVSNHRECLCDWAVVTGSACDHTQPTWWAAD